MNQNIINNTQEVGFTHAGKLGDFALSLPIASWIYKAQNKKIHFIFPKDFLPFHTIRSLLLLQPMTSNVSYVDFKVEHYGYGGQPFRFNPNDYGVECPEYYNIGFRPGLDKFVTYFYAEEYDLDIDEHFSLELGPEYPKTDETIITEEELIKYIPHGTLIDYNESILHNLNRAKAAKELFCWQSGFLQLLEYTDIQPAAVFRGTNQMDPTFYYFKDKYRYRLIQTAEEWKH